MAWGFFRDLSLVGGDEISSWGKHRSGAAASVAAHSRSDVNYNISKSRIFSSNFTFVFRGKYLFLCKNATHPHLLACECQPPTPPEGGGHDCSPRAVR